jgi:ADP-ribose pyrophosphatase
MKKLIHFDSFDQVLSSLQQTDHLLEKKLSSVTLNQSPYLHLLKDQVQTADGHFSERTFVKHPGSVMVVPRLGDHYFILVKQFRYPVQKTFFEFPAGKIDSEEPAKTAAERELAEETGFFSKQLSHLTTLYPSIGYSTERMDVYEAKDLHPMKQTPIEGEVLDVLAIRLEVLEKMIWSHLIDDPKTQLAYFWSTRTNSRST